MCGIVGSWGGERIDEALLEDAVRRMRHRGPDGAGVFLDAFSNLGFGHARLAIQDLSERGAQPMTSRSGRYTCVFNGEIYNHLDLRNELERSGAPAFRGTSDTETLLAAIEAWGVKEAVGRLDGMFAIGVWDTKRGELHLIRDRLGLKPLYVGRVNGRLVFASDLASIHAFGPPPAVSFSALAAYFRYACVPGNECIYEGFTKVEAATFHTYRTPSQEPAIHRYWNPVNARPAPRSRGEAVIEVEAAIQSAVKKRMLADVPLGVFLSGGIDSSLVVAMMRQLGRVRSFSIGFPSAAYDESSHAREVAAALDVDHREFLLTPADALATVPELADVFTEPFADSSQIPTILVSRLARADVTVVLTGDGGDEVFGGYNRHVWGPRLWQAMSRMPVFFRRALSEGLTSGRLNSATFERLVGRWFILPAEKLHKVGRALQAASPLELHQIVEACWDDTRSLLGGAFERETVTGFRSDDLRRSFMNRDLHGYLQHDILVKVDRATMSVGLEGRVPLLDHALVELAESIPTAWHFQGGTKSILRDLLAKMVPSVDFDRPKAGFGIPIDEWLRGPLRNWAESLLTPVALEDAGLCTVTVGEIWKRLQAGRPVHHQVWTVLMYLAWRRRWQG